MIAEIRPSHVSGTVTAPPSKSMAHRCLIAAALADGQSTVGNLAMSEDIKATIGSLASLGACVEVDGAVAEICGFDPSADGEAAKCFVNESGSTLRFMVPICLLSGRRIELYGANRLFERPLGVYEDICREHGIFWEKNGSSITIQGKLKPGRYELPGNVSSQFISGLLFALPLLDGDSEIVLSQDLESKPYVLMTISAIAKCGVRVDYDGARRFFVYGGQKYKPADSTVEGDYSNAAFFEAFNLIGGSVTVEGLDENSCQGDKIYSEYFSNLNKGEVLAIEDCPDLAPVLFAMAAEKGTTTFSGTCRLKIKESDRGAAMKAELAKFGADVFIDDNEIVVSGGHLHSPVEMIESHNDHRIVMAMAVLCSKYGGKINGCEAVSKSMPDFFEKIIALGAEVKFHEN